MLRLIDAWWHDSQWVDSVSLQCCVRSGHILPPYPNPQPQLHDKINKGISCHLLRNARFIGGEPPSAEIVFGQSSNWVNQFVQTPRRVNSSAFSLVTGWRKTQRARRRARQLGKKKTKQDDKHDHVSGQTVREPRFTNSHTSRGKKTAAGTVDWKQTEVHTVHQPQAEQPSEKKKCIFTPTHSTAGSRQRCSIARACARAAGVPFPLAGGCRVSAAVWKMNMSLCEESKHAASEPRRREIFPAHLLRRVDTEGYSLYCGAGLARHTGGLVGFCRAYWAYQQQQRHSELCVIL